MKNYLKLIRIKHWVKNFLIFLPIICGNAISKNNLFKTVLGFFAFSFIASFIYIINDIKDIENDKIHSLKKYRPIASGKISKKNALLVAIILLILSLLFNYLANMKIINIPLIFLLLYLIDNILYSFGLKNKAIIDIVLLSLGFIIRVYYGSYLTNILVSNWLFLTVMNGSLFLGLGKRKKELIYNKNTRESLNDYNLVFLDKFQYITMTLTLVFYSLWAIEKNNLVYTIPLLLIIFMKYSLNIENNKDGDPVNILYSDKLLLFLCSIYIIMMILLLVK